MNQWSKWTVIAQPLALTPNLLQRMENDTQVCDLSWNRTQELEENIVEKEEKPVSRITTELLIEIEA